MNRADLAAEIRRLVELADVGRDLPGFKLHALLTSHVDEILAALEECERSRTPQRPDR